jgi:hypothetical protein
MDRHLALAMELAGRDVKGPLVGADLAQAIQGKIDALDNADPGTDHWGRIFWRAGKPASILAIRTGRRFRPTAAPYG